MPGSVVIEAVDGALRPSLKEAMTVKAGELVRITTGGGGGYGKAALRPVEKVREDVLRGYVSRESALSDYGVALDDKLNVVSRRAQ